MYNPTLEQLRIQVNSRGFTFKPKELTEVPLALAEEIGSRISYRGLFVIWPNQSLEDLDDVKMQALKNFKDFNDERLLMEQSYLDERKKAGKSIDMSTQFSYNKWKKWSDELAILLREKKVIEPEGSFLDALKGKEEESTKRRGRPPLSEVTV